MSPDELLTDIRKLVAAAKERGFTEGEANKLYELVENLDQRCEDGIWLPKEWRRAGGKSVAPSAVDDD